LSNTAPKLSRRQFLGSGLAATAVAAATLDTPSTVGADGPAVTKPQVLQRKIKLGLVGCGGRGVWIAKLFLQHGGYTLHGTGDYFPEVSARAGETLGVEKSRCFSGLGGYQRLITSGIEGIALETLPCFMPEMARAAVDAGVHVYMAKPVAVDVPGTLLIGAAAKKATEKNQCFLVDYQIPTDPANIEIAKQIRAGEIGKPAIVDSRYFGGGWPDPSRTSTLESRFQSLIWCNDIALGGSHHVNACIHTIDAVLWVLGQRPVSATGFSHIARDHPHSDSPDTIAVSFEFADGVVWNHCGRHLNNLYPFESGALIHGTTGFAQVAYDGRVRLQGKDNACHGTVTNLYEAGAVRNIADFYRRITEGQWDNSNVPRAVDGTLTTILSREATRRRLRLSMDDLLKENQRLQLDLTGLRT
jgi:predicted dehydrogenase